MKSIFKHLFRNMLEQKLRTAIIVFTILFSTMVLFLALSLNTIINHTYQTMVKGTYGDANIILSKENNEMTPSFEESTIDLNDISPDKRADVVQATGKSLLSGDRKKVNIMGIPFTDAKNLGLIKRIQPSHDVTINEDEAIISHKTASEYELDVGDDVKVSINDNSQTFRIAAISETKGIFYSELDRIQMVVSTQTLQDTLSMDHDTYTSTFLVIPDDRTKDAVSKLIDANPTFTVDEPNATDSDSRDEETFRMTMITAISIIVLISGYVIISLAKVIITERMPVIGTFRSIGTSKRLMHSILAFEFLLYGVIGAMLGILAGSLLLPSVADIFNEYKAYGVETEVSYHIVFMVIAFLFGLIFPVLISLFHILKASSKPLKDIILNTAHTKKERSIIPVMMGILFIIVSLLLYVINDQDDLLPAALAFLLLLLGILFLIPTFLNGLSLLIQRMMKNAGGGELQLGIKNMANNKVIANNCSMIIVVFLLMLMIGTTGGGLDAYVTKTLKTSYDIIISDLEKEPSDYKDITNFKDVTDSEVQYVDLATYKIKNKSGEFSIIGVDDITHFADFNNGVTFKQDAKNAFSNQTDGVIIDAYQKGRYGLDIGDTIQLKASSATDDAAYMDVVVSGVMDGSVLNSNKTSVLMHMETYKDHFTTDSPNIALKVDKGADVPSVKNEMAEKYFDTALSIHTFDEMIAGQKDTIDTLLNGIIVVVLLGLVIGLLGITNNFIVSFMQRKKEFAVLYSVSMSRTQLIKMLIYEMLMTYIALIIIGFIGGYAMYIIMGKLLVALGLVIPLTFDFGLYGLLSGAAFILLTVSTISTIRRVKKLNMLKELRYE